MSSQAARAMFLDASVLVAIYSDEPRSALVRARCEAEPLRYTTPFCYYEAMNVLKSKWKFKKQIDFQTYREACTSLTAWFGAIDRKGWVKDSTFLSPEVLRDVRTLVERSELDFSDAFQIYSLKCGYFSVLTGESSAILATADAELARVARQEGVKAWQIDVEAAPQ